MNKKKYDEIDISPKDDGFSTYDESSGWIGAESLQEMPLPYENPNIKRKLKLSAEPARNKQLEAVEVRVPDRELKYTPNTRVFPIKLKHIIPFIKYIALYLVLWFTLQIIMLDSDINMASIFLSLVITFLVVCLNYRDTERKGVLFDTVRLLGGIQYNFWSGLGNILKPIGKFLFWAIIIFACLALLYIAFVGWKGA